VTLHAADMTVKRSTLTLVDADSGRSIGVEGASYDQYRDFFVVHLDEDVSAGRTYLFSADFTAKLNDDLNGFYRSQYTNAKGDKIYLATTQFEATHARKAFPCLDEPALKAVFEVSLGRTRTMSSISNMPAKAVGVPV